MATGTISSLGIGSGIDSNSLVTQLMALERRPLTLLNAKESAFSAQISALGTIRSRLADLQSSAKTLGDPNALAAYQATAGDADVMSATAGTFAREGSYSVNVQQLAAAQKSFSSLYGSTDTFGSGTLSFNINGTTQDVTISSTGNSLQDIANDINDADIGVRATIVNGDSGSRLVLTSRETGTDNAFTLSVTSGDANLTSLGTFDGANPNAVAAANSIIQVEGETVTSQSNQITSAIPNVTISAKALGTSTLDVARDTSGIADSAQAFVDAYNALKTEIGSKTAYNSETKEGEPLNGDSTMRTLLGRMRDAIGQPPSSLSGSAFEYLYSMGIELTQDGTLTLNKSKLEDAVTSDFNGVVGALGAYGTAFDDMASAFTDTDGLLDSRVTGIESSMSGIEGQRDRIQRQLDLTEARLRAQFTALDTLMASLTTTSTYLSQQLSSLPGSSSS
ncbi:flagellar filament capping protein FliD [Nitrogeniibacter aestuarii]|uniref:flagellar filament capping protein FliD n=1 Tax=Nitrogeniibacter aestuarii TaxID=2815343 RepID=UPI001D115622|nr:flagellar filament capping protein FliD [Nitrogeniibacter aestuarii]